MSQMTTRYVKHMLRCACTCAIACIHNIHDRAYYSISTWCQPPHPATSTEVHGWPAFQSGGWRRDSPERYGWEISWHTITEWYVWRTVVILATVLHYYFSCCHIPVGQRLALKLWPWRGPLYFHIAYIYCWAETPYLHIFTLLFYVFPTSSFYVTQARRKVEILGVVWRAEGNRAKVANFGFYSGIIGLGNYLFGT